jgi:hypothetical protein
LAIDFFTNSVNPLSIALPSDFKKRRADIGFYRFAAESARLGGGDTRNFGERSKVERLPISTQDCSNDGLILRESRLLSAAIKVSGIAGDFDL